MNHGDYILELLKKYRGTGRTILLIRHSVRESLRCIPDGLHEDVPITPEGIVHAEEFGRKLRAIVPDKSLLIGHTAPRRCCMTAESIRSGYSSPANTRDLGILPDIESVIVDHGNFSALWDELGWHTLMRQWLGGEIPEQTIHNPHDYSNRLLRKLVSFPAIEDTGLLVVVAHDVTIMPIIASACGTTLTTIDFLNGGVINGDESGAEIQFADPENSLCSEWSPE
jgi:broad specificity phosphatase PhoE